MHPLIDLPSAPFSPVTDKPIWLSEIISALTFALDLTEGALPGHSLRCCLLGMRIGLAAGLSQGELASLYYALQLKDAGCSSNAARMSAMVGGGDDRVLKNASKLTDWTRGALPDPRYLRELWHQCRPAASLRERVRHLFDLATSPENHTAELFTLRCERGADIAEYLHLGGPVAEAVRSLDEHWDGSGYPEGKHGQEISLLSRISLIAQHLDVCAVATGPARAIASLKTHRRKWYDPQLVSVAQDLHRSGSLWIDCLPSDNVEGTRRAVLELDPGVITELTEARVDSICEAFAAIVDAKSPFTFRHSLGVMQVACAIAAELGLSPSACNTIRRTALLHDVGKLAISNAILDKTDKLTEAEWNTVRTHPGISGSILRRVPSFTQVALLAEQHHERLDGSGYPYRHRGAELSLESRIIALADCYSAMAEHRPYRDGMPRERVFALLAADAPHRLDGDCYSALQSAAGRWKTSFPESIDALQPREAIPEERGKWQWPTLAAGGLSAI